MEEQVLEAVNSLKIASEKQISEQTGIPMKQVQQCVNSLLRDGKLKVHTPDIKGKIFKVKAV
jgi:hypothetical protein